MPINVKLDSGRMKLLEVLDRHNVKTSDMISWMVYRLESLPEDIRDGLEDDIEEEDRESEAERIEELTSDLNILSWGVAYQEDPHKTSRLLDWVREMDARIAQQKVDHPDDYLEE